MGRVAGVRNGLAGGAHASLIERGVRPVDIPLVDTVGVAGVVDDAPARRVWVPAFLAAAQLAGPLLWRTDGDGHTRGMDAAQQKDTA